MTRKNESRYGESKIRARWMREGAMQGRPSNVGLGRCHMARRRRTGGRHAVRSRERRRAKGKPVISLQSLHRPDSPASFVLRHHWAGYADADRRKQALVSARSRLLHPLTGSFTGFTELPGFSFWPLFWAWPNQTTDWFWLLRPSGNMNHLLPQSNWHQWRDTVLPQRWRSNVFQTGTGGFTTQLNELPLWS